MGGGDRIGLEHVVSHGRFFFFFGTEPLRSSGQIRPLVSTLGETLGAPRHAHLQIAETAEREAPVDVTSGFACAHGARVLAEYALREHPTSLENEG